MWRMAFHSICIFCGSSSGRNPVYAEATVALAQELLRREIGVVYGGGNVGLMGLLADTMLAEGGRVTGVIPQGLLAKEVGHRGLTELLVVESMHERKAAMAARSDAFIALPGGFGTFEEFCEIVTWTQLGLHQKPAGLLDVHGYYAGLIRQFDHAVAEGFLKPENRAIVLRAESAPALLDALFAWQPLAVDKWLDRTQQT
jgi:uncharacterized protein (TIGR00730 family)